MSSLRERGTGKGVEKIAYSETNGDRGNNSELEIVERGENEVSTRIVGRKGLKGEGETS